MKPFYILAVILASLIPQAQGARQPFKAIGHGFQFTVRVVKRPFHRHRHDPPKQWRRGD